jgi:hypothetical protein
MAMALAILPERGLVLTLRAGAVLAVALAPEMTLKMPVEAVKSVPLAPLPAP